MISQERAQKILDEHNCHRARYGAPPVEWDWDLARQAQTYANKAPRMEHSSKAERTNPAQGENLAAAWNTRPPAATGTAGWIAEEANYDCASNKCLRSQCGHWTQMLWEGTTKIGCGAASDTIATAGFPYSEHLVCRYSPPGNIVGQKPVRNCNPSSGPETCRNLSQFNGPKVPPQTGASLQPQPQQPQAPQQAPRPTPPVDEKMPPRGTTTATPPSAATPSASVPPSRPSTAPLPTQKDVPQQAEANFIDVNGMRIYYAPEQAQKIGLLSAQQRQQLANRVRGIQPEYHPQIIYLFFAEYANQNVKTVYGRADQREAITQLSAKEYNDLYNFASSVPREVQHCAIEEFLVQRNKAVPTRVCIEAAERGEKEQQRLQAEQPPVLPSATAAPLSPVSDVPTPEPVVGEQDEPVAEQQPVEPQPSFTRAWYVADKDPAEAPVLPEAITHSSEFGTTTATIVIASVAATLIIVALIVFVVVVVRKKLNGKRTTASSEEDDFGTTSARSGRSRRQYY